VEVLLTDSSYQRHIARCTRRGDSVRTGQRVFATAIVISASEEAFLRSIGNVRHRRLLVGVMLDGRARGQGAEHQKCERGCVAELHRQPVKQTTARPTNGRQELGSEPARSGLNLLIFPCVIQSRRGEESRIPFLPY
jgi:hypothetical protein